MRARPLHSATLALLLGAALPSGAAVARETCPTVRSADAIAAAGPDGTVRLRSGREVRLLDVRLAPGGKAAETARGLLGSLAGSDITVDAAGQPDRWGRLPASLALAGAAPVDLADLLVAEALAVVDPDTRDALCRPDLLAAEGRARTRRAGLWAASGWPLAATDTAALAAAADSGFAIVEGRVLSVGERRERTYLNFGRNWATDFSVTIPRRSWAAFKARGLDAAALTGRRVRVRGNVEIRRGPTMELTVPDVLELLDKPPATKPAP